MIDRWGAVAKDDIHQALLVHLLTYGETHDARPIADWVLALACRAYAEGLERGAVIASPYPFIVAAIRREKPA